MATKRQVNAISLYADLMSEVKVRMTSIRTATDNFTGIPGPLIREYCFLQLRMICEIIALACLTAHGDIKATQSKKLSKEYSAERIFKMLENLHPDFYPHPSRMTKKGPNRFHLEQVTDGFLTKDNLLLLYVKCGDVLHRGSIKKLLSDKTPLEADFTEILDLWGEIQTLLKIHRVGLLDGKTHIMCLLHDEKQGGAVQVVIAEAIDELRL